MEVILTREEALRLGIIHCECGHPPNSTGHARARTVTVLACVNVRRSGA